MVIGHQGDVIGSVRADSGLYHRPFVSLSKNHDIALLHKTIIAVTTSGWPAMFLPDYSPAEALEGISRGVSASAASCATRFLSCPVPAFRYSERYSSH